MKLYRSILFLLPLMACMVGCKKYAIAPLLADPAYIRVFNNLTATVDVVHSQQAAPFLTFVMDPKTDASGIPGDGSVIGDFLGTRELFSLSYPINEANSSVSGDQTLDNFGRPDRVNLNPINYEYPGNAHVLTAPVINGFDLSAWAQVPSGKHRIMFVVRPQNSTGFRDLSTTQRSNILLDTTVNFVKGEVYTLEVISRDLDNNKYGLYIRHEQFIHQAFDPDKIYAGFINLSGKTPATSAEGSIFYFPDKVKISCTYNIYNTGASVPPYNVFYNPYPGYNNTYFSTLITKMDTAISYVPLPLLPESSFFYQGLLNTYTPAPFGGARQANQGSLPFFSFYLLDAENPIFDPNASPQSGYLLSSSADPHIINNYDPNVGVVTQYTPNFNLIVNTGSAYHVYSTLNILELVYNRIYMMQVQRGFDTVPQN